MAKKKTVKETYEEIAVEKTVKENYADVLNETNEILLDAPVRVDLGYLNQEIQKLNKRLTEISNLINGVIVECNYNFGHDKSINKRIDNIIDAHERCKTLRNL